MPGLFLLIVFLNYFLGDFKAICQPFKSFIGVSNILITIKKFMLKVDNSRASYQFLISTLFCIAQFILLTKNEIHHPFFHNSLQNRKGIY